MQAQIKDQIAKHEPSWDEVQEEWETVQDIANSDNKMWDRIALTHSEQTQNESVNENTAFSILDLNNLQPNQCTMDPNQTQQPKQQWKQQDKKNLQNVMHTEQRHHQFDLTQRNGCPKQKHAEFFDMDMPAKWCKPVRQHHAKEESKIMPDVWHKLE